MPRGGKRPGAGRKKGSPSDDFRAYWRQRLNTPGWRRHLETRLKKSDSLLAAVINKIAPTPVAVGGEDEGPPIQVRVVADNRLGTKP